MKKIIVITALALVAGAAFNSIEAKKKKVVATPVAAPVILTTGSDSVSYAAGMAVTSGLVSYLARSLDRKSVV